jgi:hypothetical protein
LGHYLNKKIMIVKQIIAQSLTKMKYHNMILLPADFCIGHVIYHKRQSGHICPGIHPSEYNFNMLKADIGLLFTFNNTLLISGNIYEW